MRSLLVIPIVAALGCGASEQYVYTPETTNAEQAGMPAARVQIPPELPQGSVEVVSTGITRITPQGQAPLDAIHVRMTVSNDGDPTAWRVDTRNQLLEIPGEGRARPLFANSDLRTLPVVTIPEKQQHVIDLFYPMPQTMDERNLPQFDLVWQVDTATRAVSERTAFDREQDIAPEASYASGYGDPYWYPYGYGLYGAWGSNWYYDPFWGYGGIGWHHPRPWFYGRGYRAGRIGVGHVAGRYHAGGFHGGGMAHGGGHGGGHR